MDSFFPYQFLLCGRFPSPHQNPSLCTKKGRDIYRLFLYGIRQRPILPGRVQPSTFGTEGLNCCVRDGNRWNPFVIATGNGELFSCRAFCACLGFRSGTLFLLFCPQLARGSSPLPGSRIVARSRFPVKSAFPLPLTSPLLRAPPPSAPSQLHIE